MFLGNKFDEKRGNYTRKLLVYRFLFFSGALFIQNAKKLTMIEKRKASSNIGKKSHGHFNSRMYIVYAQCSTTSTFFNDFLSLFHNLYIFFQEKLKI